MGLVECEKQKGLLLMQGECGNNAYLFCFVIPLLGSHERGS